MAKATKKKTSTRKKTTKARSPRKGGTSRSGPKMPVGDASGKHLVIVESPTKAKTINKYLGRDYMVMASVGHVRDLPSRNPKGIKNPVPGVDLEHDFQPTYDILPDKKKTITALRKAAKQAADVWFATDLDREGEAIAWHLAEALGVDIASAKRVVFNAITKSEIEHAFNQPRSIDINRVNAQQARRILDRIVGYQVSPLLWKKVAGGLSAGRVQSVATRLVVEREREIEAFIPEEYWKVTGIFATELAKAAKLSESWLRYITTGEDENPRTVKEKVAWLSQHACLRAELVEFEGESFKPEDRDTALATARALGFVLEHADERQDEKGKGPARFPCVYHGTVGDAPKFAIDTIETKRTTSRPPAPFITSTLQQAAANRMGFALQRTMRIAQQLYEGIDLKGARGQTGLITYMRTDSTHLSGEALNMARSFIESEYDKGTGKYLPAKPNFFSSSNKAAQEAHEAIRPTDASITPASIRDKLGDEQFKLYDLIWRRFVACQMTAAQWDSTAITIRTQSGPAAAFRATGRTLAFDGFYKVAGIPTGGDDVILPPLEEKQPVAPIQIDPTQHFTSPPPRYTEASLQKKLEEEGIGRPSTYAAIIGTIQARKYVDQVAPRDRRLLATDLGKVVTDKLIEGFPTIMDVAYTREMEAELDKIEDEHHDWIKMLQDFYGPFKKNLENAHESMVHAKAETEPAPFECAKCGAATVYRFGRNGRFLSCATYPECDYAAPIDREGNPQEPEMSDIACPLCNAHMTRRVGRFGPFLGCVNYPECKGIVKLDPKKGTVVLPKAPPLQIDIPCPKCDAPLNMRRSKRGPWLSCSTFPKCRGRAGFASLEEDKQAQLEAVLEAHEKANPVPDIKTVDGKVIDETYIPRILGDDEKPAAADEDITVDAA